MQCMDTLSGISPRRIGIVGYGNLGQFLVEHILESKTLTLAFVWNRSADALTANLDEKYILPDLDQFSERKPDLIVEVAHPSITKEYGAKFLQHADYMIGSPTALCDQELETKLRKAAQDHGLYIPAGAFWGGEDVKKMADRGTLQALKVTMTFHPDSFRLTGDLKTANERVVTNKTVLYDGPVRALCPMAPNNTNTMAAACAAAHNLGFDKVSGCLISDPSLTDYHIVEVDVWGPGDISAGTAFHVHTVRKNPAKVGHVTGSATFKSFLSSMLNAKGKGPGAHLC